MASFITAHQSSLEWTLPCHGGDHRFKSGMGRLLKRCGTPTAERLVLETSVCGFESHLHHCGYFVCEVYWISTRLCEGRRPGSSPGVDAKLNSACECDGFARLSSKQLDEVRFLGELLFLWCGALIGIAAEFKPRCLWVQVPPVPLVMTWYANWHSGEA